MKKILYGLLAFLFVLPLSLAVVGCKKQTCTITYMVGEEIYKTQTIEAGQKIPEIDNPTKDNYDFMGWYLSEISQKKITNDTSINGDLTVYARFKLTQYNITYVLNGGINVGANQKTYTAEDSFNFSAAIKQGYDFDAWYDNANFEGDPVTGITLGTTGDKTVYAKWNLHDYSIEYHLLGGEIEEGANPTTYTYETNTITLAAPTKVDENGVVYTFLGWFTNEFSGDKVTTIPKHSAGDVKLYARWEATLTVNEHLVENINSTIAELDNDHYNAHNKGDVLSVEDLNLTNDYYVLVGEFLNIGEVESVSFGNAIFEQNQEFNLSIGKNAKVVAKAFYTTDNSSDELFGENTRVITKLYVAAPILAVEFVDGNAFKVNDIEYKTEDFNVDELEITDIAFEDNDVRNTIEEIDDGKYLCTITTGQKFIGFGNFEDSSLVFLTRKYYTYANGNVTVSYGLTDLDDIAGGNYLGFYPVGWIEDGAADKDEKLAYNNGLTIDYTMFGVTSTGEMLGVKTIQLIINTEVVTVSDSFEQDLAMSIGAFTMNYYNEFHDQGVKSLEELGINKSSYYVAVGTLNRDFTVNSIAFDDTVYNATDKVKLSIGLNTFVDDYVFYVENKVLYVAATIFATETISVPTFKINNIAYYLGEPDIDEITADVGFYYHKNGTVEKQLDGTYLYTTDSSQECLSIGAGHDDAIANSAAILVRMESTLTDGTKSVSYALTTTDALGAEEYFTFYPLKYHYDDTLTDAEKLAYKETHDGYTLELTLYAMTQYGVVLGGGTYTVVVDMADEM